MKKPRVAGVLARLACAGLGLLSLVAAPSVAEAAGPGVGNLDCGDAEYFKPFAFIENKSGGPNGTNVAVMINGYFMTVFAPDSGLPPGEIGIYDVSNPKFPNEVKHIKNTDTSVFREAHSLPVGYINGRQYIAFQTTKGIQFWDFTDPLNASRIGSIDLPGVNGGDYENVAWQTSWQGRYLYVAGGNRGIYIVDAGDPTKPQLLKVVPTSSTGGFRVGPIFAMGDYLIISNMDQGGAYAVLDISEPAAPALLAQRGWLPRIYAIVVGPNDRIYAAGRDGNFLTHTFADPTKIDLVKDALIGEDQLYAAVQDHYVFLGRQNNVVKVDVTDIQNPKVVGQGTLGRAHPDHGQVTPMGNLVYIGNDHGTGSAFFCHQHGKDVTPLVPQSVYPKDGSVGVGQKARINVLFSDHIDTLSINSQNVIVRPVNGQPLPGIVTYAFNTLSFGPDQPLAPDTTYEIVFPKGGLRDVMGNALPEEVIYRFSTGDQVVVPPPPPEPDPPGMGGGAGAGGGGFGGAGGMFGSAGTGFGGMFASAGTGGVGGVGGAGGVPAAAGSAGTGGVAPGAGGAPAPAADPDMTDQGASCSVAGSTASSSVPWVFMAALAGLLRRRGSRRA